MSLLKDYYKLRDTLLSIEGDVKKTELAHTKAAAKRARRGLMDVKKKAHSLRQEITLAIKA